ASCPNAVTCAWNVCRTGIAVLTSTGGCASSFGLPAEQAAKSKVSPQRNAKERKEEQKTGRFFSFIGFPSRFSCPSRTTAFDRSLQAPHPASCPPAHPARWRFR